MREVGIQQQVGQLRGTVKGFFDPLQKARPNNTATAPNHRNFAKAKLPVILNFGCSHQGKALGIGADFGTIQRVLNSGDKRLAIARKKALARPFEHRCGIDPFFFKGANATGKHRLRNRCPRNTHIEGIGGCPFARTFLTSPIHNNIDKRLTRFRVNLLQDIGCHFNQKAIELTLVPVGKNRAHLARGEVEHLRQQMIGFADHLHIAVLNAVMYHFDVVTRTVGANVGCTGYATADRLTRCGTLKLTPRFGVNLRGNRLPNGFQLCPRFGIAPRHQRRAKASPFFTPRHTRAKEF